MTTFALIVAAGRGTRVGGALPKQYLDVAGTPILMHTLAVFLAHPRIDGVLVVIAPDDVALYRAAVPASQPKLHPPVLGGATRQISVRKGLEALAAAHAPTEVLIHDAVRPFLGPPQIDACLAPLAHVPAAVAGLPMTETVKVVEPGGRVRETLDRGRIWRAQTPQAFRFGEILGAHRKAATAGYDTFTDDAAVAEWAGLDVQMVEGSDANFKITRAEDVDMAQHVLGGGSGKSVAPDIRTGHGYDIHQLVPGDHVWLCGIKIPHTHRLDGHSDADVALHALTDALLATIADADIGEHFRNTDPRWRGAASHVFLEEAARRVRAAQGRVLHVDITLLAEAPKIAPHRLAMRTRIAELLALDIARVSVKATTNEGLGAIGRREGMAALATATVTIG